MVIKASRLCIASNLFQILLQSYTNKMIEDNNWNRASGDCICPECNQSYYRHPCHNLYPTFHVLCDGKVVKT